MNKSLSVLLVPALLFLLSGPALAQSRVLGGDQSTPDRAPSFDLPGMVLTEEAKLVASDGASGDEFGLAVALSGDSALVGAWRNDNENGNNAGAVYVWERGEACGSEWCQVDKLLQEGGQTNSFFGARLAADRDRALVTSAEMVHILVRDGSCGSLWCEEFRLEPPPGAEATAFGTALAIDGDTAVVGAFRDDDAGMDAGAAYVFVRNGGCGEPWCLEAKLLAEDGEANDEFGFAVALSGDTALIGAHQDQDNGSLSGSAYVFVRDDDCDDIWCREAKLLPSDGQPTDLFGADVDLSGNTALIGAALHDSVGYQSGTAYVFTRDGDCGKAWCESTQLVPHDHEPFVQYGSSVALSGSTAIVGSIKGSANAFLSGAAWAFVRGGACGSEWCEHAKLGASDGEAWDVFGRSLAVGDGHGLVGATGDDDNGGFSGAAYLFAVPDDDEDGDDEDPDDEYGDEGW